LHKTPFTLGLECFAFVATEEHHRLVEAMKVCFELFAQLLFALDGGFGATQTKAMGDAIDVGIDRHEVGAGIFDHDDIGGLLPDPCECDQLFLL
jgi:hypothetical protein